MLLPGTQRQPAARWSDGVMDLRGLARYYPAWISRQAFDAIDMA